MPRAAPTGTWRESIQIPITFRASVPGGGKAAVSSQAYSAPTYDPTSRKWHGHKTEDTLSRVKRFYGKNALEIAGMARSYNGLDILL